jgi:hypothetical protein
LYNVVALTLLEDDTLGADSTLSWIPRSPPSSSESLGFVSCSWSLIRTIPIESSSETVMIGSDSAGEIIAKIAAKSKKIDRRDPSRWHTTGGRAPRAIQRF